MPSRVATLVRGAGFATVGELRRADPAALRRVHGLGPKLLGQLNRWLARCARAFGSTEGGASLRARLLALLTPAEYELLRDRYGLEPREDAAPRRWAATLRDLGSRSGV